MYDDASVQWQKLGKMCNCAWDFTFSVTQDKNASAKKKKKKKE